MRLCPGGPRGSLPALLLPLCPFILLLLLAWPRSTVGLEASVVLLGGVLNDGPSTRSLSNASTAAAQPRQLAAESKAPIFSPGAFRKKMQLRGSGNAGDGSPSQEDLAAAVKAVGGDISMPRVVLVGAAAESLTRDARRYNDLRWGFEGYDASYDDRGSTCEPVKHFMCV